MRASREVAALLAATMLCYPAFAWAQTAPAASEAPAAPVPPAAPAPPARTHIAEGTAVRVTLDEALSSASAQEGDEFAITTSDPIDLGNGVVIPAGFHGRGEVTSVEKRGMLGKAGQLSVRLDYVKIGDTKVRLRSNQSREGKSTQGSVIVLSLLITPLFLLMHGKDAKIPVGTPVSGFVDDDAEVVVPTSPPTPG